jgi:predicted RNA binding protein YcfA (HicA-like mRNA interferase family)
MPKLPRIKGQDAIRAFEKAGFILARVKGSHHRLVKDGCHSIAVPVHAGKDMKTGTLRGLIKAAGLTVEEFCAFLDE